MRNGNGCSRSFLSTEDQQLVVRMRDGHVLQDDMTPTMLPGSGKGLILVSCADGDRFPDIFAHKLGAYKDKAGQPCMHSLALNGGAPTMAPNSPFTKIHPAQGEVFLQNIADALVIKQLQTVALYGHAPCGVAQAHAVGLRQLVALLIAAKRRIKDDVRFENVRVACFLHCDYADERMRTYFVSAREADEWLKQNPE